MQYEGRVRASALDWISLALVIIGAINWGLVGVGNLVESNWNVVDLLFGAFPTIEALIYVLVGLAGLYELYFAYQLYDARNESEPTRERVAQRRT